MLVVSVIDVYCSLKSHLHTYEPENHEHGAGSSGGLNKWVAIAILIAAWLVFSALAQIITENVSKVIEQLRRMCLRVEQWCDSHHPPG
jgi:Ca2+/H+ antiporter